MSNNADPPTESSLRRLVEQLIDRVEAQDTDGVSTLLAAHPSQAAAARKQLSALASAGLLEEPTPRPKNIGRFCVVGEAGRGGMGVVYIVTDPGKPEGSADLALKLLPPEHRYSGEAKSRFKREVQAIALLDHPGIVRTLEVGDHEGLPFFVMELVDGVSCADALMAVQDTAPTALTSHDLFRAAAHEAPIADRTWIDTCLRLIKQTGTAMIHAHERGVWHRDLKPSNIMVRADGAACVLDFGLARVLESDDTLTRTGRQPGSMPYMAPEQVRGAAREIGPWTDVYGLGVLMFELLALRPPFGGSSIEEIRDGILSGRARSLRKLNPDVSRSIATVCQHAMERDRQRRYQSMQAFVADLDALLEHRPVTAQPAGIWLRARRWAAWHPIGATALCVGSTAALVFAIVFMAKDRTTGRQLNTAFAARDDERERADDTLDDAILAIETLLAAGDEDPNSPLPARDPERRELLKRAVALYERLLVRESGNARVSMGATNAWRKLAGAHAQLGPLSESEAISRRALAACNRAMAKGVAEPDAAKDQLRLQRRNIATFLLRVLFQRGKLEGAEDLALELVKGDDPAFAATIQEGNRLVQVGIAWRILASLQNLSGERKAMDASLRRAIALLETAIRTGTLTAYKLHQLAGALRTHAYFRGFADSTYDYETQMKRSLTLRTRALKAENYAEGRAELAGLHMNWTHLDLRYRRFDSASEHAKSAMAVLDELTSKYPDRMEYANLALKVSYHAVMASRELDEKAFTTRLTTALRLADSIQSKFPRSAVISMQAAILWTTEARRLKEPAAAARSDVAWNRAEELWLVAAETEGPDLAHIMQIGVFFDNRGWALLRRKEFDRARTDALAALNWHARAKTRLPGQKLFDTRLGKSTILLATILVAQDKFAEAATVLVTGFEADLLSPAQVGRDGFRQSLSGEEQYRAMLQKLPKESSGVQKSGN